MRRRVRHDPAMRPTLFCMPLIALASAPAVFAQTAPSPTKVSPATNPAIGHYRLAGGPDVAADLAIEADGHFFYVLAAGALDEQASGRWVADGTTIRLTTEPKPRPATIATGAIARTDEGPLKLLVTWPTGDGIAGVDFVIGFDSGDPVTGYTQDYGWTMQPDETRVPRWVELVEPIHGIVSPRFPIDLAKGNALTFVLTPNDLGIHDFEAATVEVRDGELLLHRGDATLRFVRAAD